MKFNRYLLMAMLFVSASAFANAFHHKIEIIEQFDNLKMIAFLDVEDFNSNPEWNPNKDAPPLNVTQAIQAVKTFKKNTGMIKEIEIRQMPKHESKWHYLIKVANETMKSKYSIYVVLMSGKVIPSIIQPQGYK